MIPALQSDGLLDAALAYAQRGFYVFPCWWIDAATGQCACGEPCTSPGKHPRTAHGLNDSTVDEAKIHAYWTTWPNANVAIDCGRSGLAVVDVDTKKGAIGKATIKWYLEKYPEFATAELCATPTGGYHYWFYGAAKSSQGALGPGVDVRSLGGYVLAPPSVAFGRYDEDKHPIAGSESPYTLLRPATTLPPLPGDLALAPASESFRLGDIANEARAFDGTAREAIPHGEHRQALLWLAWHLRRVHGLTTDAALPTIAGFISSGALSGYDPTNPFLERDLRGMLERIEPEIATNAPDIPTNPLEGLVSVLDAARTERALEWLVDQFVPFGELVLLFGDGGVGKTTGWGWVAAQTTMLGRNVGALTIEEPFARFGARAVAMGADPKRIIGPAAPPVGLKFREHLAWLDAFVREHSLAMLYFDSLRSHFDLGKGEDSATNARNNLSGIAALAQATGCLVAGTFHTNKAQLYSGSTEMRNVPRMLLEARPYTDESITISVDKSHVRKPEEKMRLQRRVVQYRNALGEQLHEIVHRPGATETREQTLAIFERVSNVAVGATTLGAAAGVDETKDTEIRHELALMPALSANQVFLKIGGKRAYVLGATKRIRVELGLDPA